MDKVEVTYINRKKSKTILFLHGWGGNKDSFVALHSLLQQNYNLISLNLMDIQKYYNASLTLYDYANYVFKLIQKQNIKKVHIICHSFGGRLAILLASMYHINILSCIIIDGAGVRERSFKLWLQLRTYKMIKKCVKMHILPVKILKKFGSDEYRTLSDIEKQTFRNIVNYDLKKYLSAILVPTTLIWGKKDKITTMQIAKILQKNIVNSRLIVYGKGTHFSYLDCPFEFMRDVENHFKWAKGSNQIF